MTETKKPSIETRFQPHQVEIKFFRLQDPYSGISTLNTEYTTLSVSFKTNTDVGLTADITLDRHTMMGPSDSTLNTGMVHEFMRRFNGNHGDYRPQIWTNLITCAEKYFTHRKIYLSVESPLHLALFTNAHPHFSKEQFSLYHRGYFLLDLDKIAEKSKAA